MNIKTWIDYGRELAEKHPDILHQDAANKRAFQVFDVEDAFGDLKSLTGDVIVRWLIPTYAVQDPGGSPLKNYSSGFIILVKHRRGQVDDFIEAIAKAERISDEFLARIRYDSQEDSLLFLGGEDSLDEMQIIGNPLKGGGDSSYSGWITILNIMSPFESDCVEGKWTDL